MSTEFLGYRDIWIPCGPIKSGTSFRITFDDNQSFVGFRTNTGSLLLRIGRNADNLVIAGEVQRGTIQPLVEPVQGPSGSMTVTLAHTGCSATVDAEFLDEPIDLSIDITQVFKVLGAGRISEFSTSYDNLAAVRASKESLFRTVSELPRIANFPKRTDDLVFDFGMWNGDDTSFYLKKGFRVVGIEANPDLALRCAMRFPEEIADGRLRIVNLGVADREAQLPFAISLVSSEQNSFNHKMAERHGPVQLQTIETVTPARLWNAFGVPHYAKIDIESFDRFVLDSLKQLDEKPSFISFECAHEGWQKEFRNLSNLGYRRFQFADQRQVPAIRLTKPSREGKYVQHQFNPGSSGPFGSDLQGTWFGASDYQVALDNLRAQNPNNKGWYDVHAAL